MRSACDLHIVVTCRVCSLSTIRRVRARVCVCVCVSVCVRVGARARTYVETMVVGFYEPRWISPASSPPTGVILYIGHAYNLPCIILLLLLCSPRLPPGLEEMGGRKPGRRTSIV